MPTVYFDIIHKEDDAHDADKFAILKLAWYFFFICDHITNGQCISP